MRYKFFLSKDGFEWNAIAQLVFYSLISLVYCLSNTVTFLLEINIGYYFRQSKFYVALYAVCFYLVVEFLMKKIVRSKNWHDV